MMFFLCLFALSAGYFLNEEASLRRICKAVSYRHEGWLVLHGEYGMWLFLLACLVSLIKGYIFGLFLKSYNEQAFFFIVLSFMLGNVLALKRSDGLGYTYWLALSGLLFARDTAVFQAVFTVFAVGLLLTKKLSLSIKLWRVALFFFTLIFCHLIEALFWTVLITVGIFCGRQSPIPSDVIEYCGRIFKWRVTL